MRAPIYRGHILLGDDPRIPALIPSTKRTPSGALLVPHGVEETRLLRNLGYQVDSPILHEYQWAGTEPFDAQRTTAAMLVSNPRSFVLNGLGCVDADTEYLSPTGWRKISAYDGSPVAQYNPTTRQAEFVDKPAYVKLPCSTMIRVKTAYGIDQLLSPEHRMLIEAKGSGATEVVHAEELYRRGLAWCRGERAQCAAGRVAFTQAAIPVVFGAPAQPGIPLTDAQLRVQVMFHADGCIRRDTLRKGVVRVKKERKKERIRALLRAAHIEWSERSRDYPTAKGYTVFRFAPPLLTKTYGAMWWSASPAQLAVIADEALHWDGSVGSKPGARWSSRSAGCADFIQYALCTSGRPTRLTVQTRRRGRGEEVDYTLSVRDSAAPLGLRGLGVDGERRCNMWLENSADGFKYCFMVPSTFLVFRRNGCVFVSGNTGKTRSALYAFDYRRQRGEVSKMLVVAPLSTLRATWMRELTLCFPHLRGVVVRGTPKKRDALLNDDADVYVINHHGVKAMLPQLKARRFDYIVLDETTVYRNRMSDIWKMTRALVDTVPWVTGMTGTPTPQDPTDAYAQVKLINPAKMPQAFGAFRERVCVKVNEYKFVPRRGWQEVVQEVMQPSVRFTRDDCFDLPPVQYIDREVTLGPQQTQLYSEMAATSTIQHAQGKIVASNEADAINKLLQIALGVVYNEKHEPIELDGTERLRLLEEVIEQSASKVLVFTPYKSTLAMLHREVSKRWSCEAISGDTPEGKRSQVFGAFQLTAEPHVIVAHPKCMAHGLTLTEASTVVWFGPVPSLELYEQANARITRAGQRHSQLIVHLMGTRVEKDIFNRLRNRSAMQGVLLDLLRDQGVADIL